MDTFSENIGRCVTGIVLLIIILRNISEIKKSMNLKSVSFPIILALTLGIASLPLLIFLLLIFFCYRQVVYLILKNRHGAKFGGLMKGADAFHTMSESSNSIINSLMMIERTKDSPKDFYEIIRQTIWRLSRDFKFRSIFLKSLGYSYIVNANLTIDDCIRKMKTISCNREKIEEEELITLLTEYSNSPLPKDNTISWEVLIGTQPVNWKKAENEYYPVLFRIHHAVADGVTLIKLMVGLLADQQNVKVMSNESWINSEVNKKYTTSSDCYHNNNRKEYKEIDVTSVVDIVKKALAFCNGMQSVVESLLKTLYVILLAPAAVVVSFMLKANDCNILHSTQLTGKKVLSMNIEETDEYFLKTKRIKNKVPGTSFPNVLLTAFSASLNDYFKKSSSTFPERITVTIPIVSGSSELKSLIPGEIDVDTVHVGNYYSLLLMNLPVFTKNTDEFEKTPLINRLKLVNKESNILKHSLDYQINYFTVSAICPLLPLPIVNFILGKLRCTSVVSVLPGPPKVTYAEKTLNVSDLVCWVPHLHGIGTTLSIITYDGRLHVGFCADEALISDQSEVKKIADGIYKYLDLLEEEVNSIS